MAGLTVYPKLTQYKSTAAFKARLAELGCSIPCDERILTAAEHSPMAEPIEVFGRRLGNRWCIQPMEGWDGTPDGRPTEWTRRRWENFGRSGAKFIWGGEAVAVRHEGRANPNQLWLTPATQGEIARLREALLAAHREAIKHPPQPPLGKGGRRRVGKGGRTRVGKRGRRRGGKGG